MRNERHRLTVAGVDIHVEAPKPVMHCLSRMLERVEPGGKSPSATQFVVDAGHHHQSALAAADALIAEVAQYVAAQLDTSVLQGAVVSQGDVTLALVGAPASAALLAAHLTARGWSLLAPRYAFLNFSSLTVLPFPTLMQVQATAMDRYPKAYRRAFEMSAWCSDGETLNFYAVDPAKAKPSFSWAQESRLSGLVLLDDEGDSAGTLTELEPHESDPIFGAPSSEMPLRRARLTFGPMVFTTTALVRWAERGS
ncbi:MAG TPA: hypothetical protein VME66_13450 [Candidatus Acidoferrales bacterium]|nr:hypothetical protein [Candidatus Acidoferrales bacterium]